MRYLSLFLAATFVVSAGTSALGASRRPHRHASHARKVTAAAHTKHFHHSRGRRSRLEARDESPDIAIPNVPLLRAKLPLLPPLKGSHASLVRQNERSEADGLERIENDAHLEQLRARHALVALPVDQGMRVNPDLPLNRRYTRPWTAEFLNDLARAHYARFQRPLQVNSAVRTVEYQRHLIEINGNAAPADGDIASPHLTGTAVDIAKKGLSFTEVAWMRAYLLPLQTAGKLDVEEEFYQSCFHISVYKSYLPQAKSPAKRGNSSALIATRVP